MQEIIKGWKKVKLDEICIQVTDGTHDSPKLLDKGIPLIKGKNISGGLIDFENSDKISYEDHLKVISRSKPEKGNILFSNIGSVGDTVLIKTDIEFSIKNVALFKANQDKVCNLYLYYSVLNPFFKNDLLNKKSGSAQPFITLSVLRNQDLIIPENIQTQQKIASILSKYDDLIENNNKRIKILEETAQSIYEEWFVKYNFPGSENIKMIDSGNDDFGMIPEGWRIGKIKDFGNIITGKTPSKSKEENYGNYMSFIKTPDLHGNFYCLNTNENLSEIGVNTQKNKIIPKDSLVVSCIGTVGVVGITSKDSQTNQQINSIVLNDGNNLEYLFFLLRNLKSYLEKLGANGATLLNVNKEKFSNVKVLFPKQDLLNNYSKIVKPSFNEILNLQKQNQNLKETRDLLIPRLVSGELDVESLDVK